MQRIESLTKYDAFIQNCLDIAELTSLMNVYNL